MATRALLIVLAVSELLFTQAVLFTTPVASVHNGGPDPDSDEEDLSFLDENGDESDAGYGDDGFGYHTDESSAASKVDDNDGNNTYNGFDVSDHGSYEAPPAIDESDVVVLSGGNFSDCLAKHRHVMVEFYAAWCRHCQELAPEYAAAATELRREDVVLAKMDAEEENELAQKFDIQGFPTVLFFIDGVHINYHGQRSRNAIISWIRKKKGPGVQNATTVEEAGKILVSEDRVVLGFLNSLVGAESQELAAASKLEDGVNFYQTVNPDVAKLFHIDPNAKRPYLVLLKKEEEKLSYYHDKFNKTEITNFVLSNKLPLVSTLTRDNAPEIFENPIRKQLLLLALSNKTKNVMPAFQEASKFFKGKLIFVCVETDNEDVGKPVSEYFGVTGDAPKVLAYSGNEDLKKFIFEGEITVENVKEFAEGFLEDRLKPFYRSDPIPETNNGDVKIVVGNNFDEIVLDETKDVLLEIYAPWCGYCRALEPTYNRLAKHLRGIESLVIAKLDGTTNDHPRAKSDGFPSLLFFPARNKSSEPITVDTERTVKGLYKFIKKHATISFKLQRPSSAIKGKVLSASEKGNNTVVKDEL